jgi:hypothetical protein
MAARSGNGADSGRVPPRRSRALFQAVALAAFAVGLWCLTGTAAAKAAEATPATLEQLLPPVRPLTAPSATRTDVSRDPHPDALAAGTRATDRVVTADPAPLDRDGKSVGICAIADSGPPSLPLFQPPSPTGTARATPRVRASEPAVYPD